MDFPSLPPAAALRVRKILILLLYLIYGSGLAVALYASPQYWQQPYHTSALSGHAWVRELLYGHPDQIYHELGMRLHVFIAFVAELRQAGMKDSHNITLEEKAAIFLYMSVTGLHSRHVAEQFQHSHTTICYYYCAVLDKVSSPPFYTNFVHLPHIDDPTPHRILNNPKFYPFFKDCIGAFDGSHINACPSLEDREAAWNCKGGVTQNTFAGGSVDTAKIQYMATGHDGCTSDSTMLEEAHMRDFRIPPGKYYVSDAGFASSEYCLTPYCGVRYHLAEWGHANV